MKTIYLFILTTLAATMVLSCSSQRAVVSTDETRSNELTSEWKDHTHGEIIRQFGAPTREVSDGDGGVILVYERVEEVQTTSVNTYHGHFDPDATTTTYRDRYYTEFYLNADGICYLVRTNISAKDARMSPKKRDTILGVSAGVVGVAAVVGVVANALNRPEPEW